jgi:hypothetical protein
MARPQVWLGQEDDLARDGALQMVVEIAAPELLGPCHGRERLLAAAPLFYLGADPDTGRREVTTALQSQTRSSATSDGPSPLSTSRCGHLATATGKRIGAFGLRHQPTARLL